mgnify:CR=1 FL=1
MEETNTLRKAVFTVGIVNLLYFTIEFLVALEIKSVCIFGISEQIQNGVILVHFKQCTGIVRFFLRVFIM